KKNIYKALIIANKFLSVVLLSIIIYTGCQSNFRGLPQSYHELLDSAFIKAGDNRKEIESALSDVDRRNRESAAFLIAYMPEKDLQTLDASFILDQVNGAAKVRKEFSWCRELPDFIFLNEVLPYYSLDEHRDNWREDFYNRFAPLVTDCNDIYEAIDSVNFNILKVLGV